MKFYLTLLMLALHSVIHAQKENASLTFVPKFNGDSLKLNNAILFGNDTIIITNFKFYISNLQYFKNDTLIFSSTKTAHLIDLSQIETLRISEGRKLDYDQIKFNLGIDSITNISGALDDDLDPVYGMYWTWQSGYINFKLEGFSTNCPSRNHKFYWHIGGYLKPTDALRQMTIQGNSTHELTLDIQLNKLFEGVDVSKVYNVMSPSLIAMSIADQLPQIFNIAIK